MNTPTVHSDPAPEQRLEAERRAILASCSGMIGEAALTDGAMIVLFTGMLGAGEFVAMLSTAILPLFSGVCVIPMAYWVMRIGSQKMTLRSAAGAGLCYLLALSAPFFGSAAITVFLVALTGFAVMQAGFVGGWFPLLDTFLSASRRAAYFGRTRFLQQICIMFFLGGLGVCLGPSPTTGAVQLGLLAGCLFFWGRFAGIARLPRFSEDCHSGRSWLASLGLTLKNHELLAYVLYQGGVNIAVYSVFPLTMLLLKNSWHSANNLLLLVSALSLTGMMAGYLLAAPLLKRLGCRSFLSLLHGTHLVVLAGMLAIGRIGPMALQAVGGLLVLYNFALAAASVVASSEIIRLARPGNKVVAIALGGALCNLGAGGARVASSLLLRSGRLPAQLKIAGITLDRYQLLYVVALLMTLLVFPLLLRQCGRDERCLGPG